METLAIGERKVFTDVTLEVVEVKDPCCVGCWFLSRLPSCIDHPRKSIMGYCTCLARDDEKEVIFKEVKETT